MRALAAALHLLLLAAAALAPDPPLLRLVWPLEGEHIPAGWVEVFYAVHDARRWCEPDLLLQVLVDGEPVQAPRRHPAATHGKATVWLEGHGAKTLTLLALEEEAAAEEDAEAAATRAGGTRQCGASRAAEAGAGDDLRWAGGTEDEDAAEWFAGAASVGVVLDSFGAIGMYLVSPFPGQVHPPGVVPIVYEVYPVRGAETEVVLYIDDERAQNYTIDCRIESECDAVHRASVHFTGVSQGAHTLIIRADLPPLSVASAGAGGGVEGGAGGGVEVKAVFTVRADVDEVWWELCLCVCV